MVPRVHRRENPDARSPDQVLALRGNVKGSFGEGRRRYGLHAERRRYQVLKIGGRTSRGCGWMVCRRALQVEIRVSLKPRVRGEPSTSGIGIRRAPGSVAATDELGFGLVLAEASGSKGTRFGFEVLDSKASVGTVMGMSLGSKGTGFGFEALDSRAPGRVAKTVELGFGLVLAEASGSKGTRFGLEVLDSTASVRTVMGTSSGSKGTGFGFEALDSKAPVGIVMGMSSVSKGTGFGLIRVLRNFGFEGILRGLGAWGGLGWLLAIVDEVGAVGLSGRWLSV